MHPIHPYRKAHPHSRLLTIESIIYLACVVALFLVLGAATNADPGAVLLAFFPALVFGVILLILIQTDHFYPLYNGLILVMLLVAASLVYFLLPQAHGIDAGTALVMNGILMGVALAVLHSSYAHEHPIIEGEPVEEVVETKVVHHVHHVEQPKEIAEYIHSIEDKVKALNFVIGRVYSVYHGGTESLRNKIRIDKTWYDTFNHVDGSDAIKQKHEAIALLKKIKARLDLLQKSEKEVFGDAVAQLKNIAHNNAGTDAIIDVLVRNDKDPVLQYYDGARTFCDEALKVLH
jgi:hypothetical protein